MAFIGPVIVLLAAGFALLGVVMIVRGLRGRRVGNTPHCRRCDYVVDEALLAAAFGRGAAASPKCPECGAVLRAGDAIRQGERRRRPMLAVAGLVVLLVGVPVVMAGAGGFLSSTAITKHAPTGLLLWQVRQGTQRMVDGGLAELVARNINGKLVGTEQREILDTLIERFERPSNAWTAQCQEAFSTFEAVAGPLTQGEMERLARGVKIDASFRQRERVHAGKPTPLAVVLTLRRAPPQPMMLGCSIRSLEVGDLLQQAPPKPNIRYGISHKGLMHRSNLEHGFLMVLEAPTGVHKLQADLELVLSGAENREALCRFDVHHEAEIIVDDPNQSLVKEQQTPDAITMKSLIGVRRLDLHAWPGEGGQLQPIIGITSEPGYGRPACVFDMYVVPDPIGNPRQESFIGTFRDSTFPLPGVNVPADSSVIARLRGQTKARVVLRSSAETAAERTLHTSIWKGELVYDDVPISVIESGR